MCNLYDIGPSQGKRQESIWEQIVFRGLTQLRTKSIGIRKTDPGLVLLSETEHTTMRWGFLRAFNPAINNARSDKLATGMWQAAWSQGRRCIIPVAGYYEWTGPKGQKQTHHFSALQPDRWLWAAGIWEEHPEAGPCYSMITTCPSPKTGPYHDRMPALLPEDRLAHYLTTSDPRDILLPSLDLSIAPCENPLIKEKQPTKPAVEQLELWD